MKEKILEYLRTDFEKQLFAASIAYLTNENDPLRLNSFAYSLRELIRNIFAARAPDEKVKACSWFKPEIENGAPTRQQRYIYCIQGGLSHSFVLKELEIDILQPWKDIKTAIDSLSKFTHVTEQTFNIENEECERLSNEALSSLLYIFDLMSDTKTELIYELTGHISSELMMTFVSNSMSDIDILSNNSHVEYSEITEREIIDIDHKNITFQGEGIAYVSLNYGKGEDACELNDDFPFVFKGSSRTDNPYELSISPDDISIDINSWYGLDDEQE